MKSFELVTYILSLAFQISGAILLILKYWGNTKQKIIHEYFPGAGIANNDGKDKATLDLSLVRECAIEIYSSRGAFIYIALGYALSVIGKRGNVTNATVLLMVFISSGILICIEIVIARVLAKIIYKEDFKIPYADLPEYIDRTASSKDIEELLKDYYS